MYNNEVAYEREGLIDGEIICRAALKGSVTELDWYGRKNLIVECKVFSIN